MFVMLSGALEAMLDGFREATPRKSKVMTDSPPYPFVSVCFASIPSCVSICSMVLLFGRVTLIRSYRCIMSVVLSGVVEAVLDDFREAKPRKCNVVTDSPPYPFVWAFFTAMLSCAGICLRLFAMLHLLW